MIPAHSARKRPLTRIALTGAHGGYGRTFLAQLTRTPEIAPVVLIDPNLAGVRTMLDELGFPADAAVESQEPARTAAIVAEGRIALVPGADAVSWDGIDVLVEACGRVPQGHAYAAAALDHGTHVVMVSKEVDTVTGPELAARAAERGLSYLAGDGDQPANLLRLVDWVTQVGLEIVAIGKSGEYDIEFDPASGVATQAGVAIDAPALADLLELGDDVAGTLAQRAEAVAALKRAAAADSCEMTVVATRTGAVADAEGMLYPVARIAELADIYADREDGGIRRRDGIVDVFSALRLPGEASFAGGVFAVVRTGDPVTWETLRGKGHVISRDGRYACIYWPYHYMGVETPLSVHAAIDGGAALAPRWSTLLAARAQGPLMAGTTFAVAGHHHEIDGVAPVMIDAATGIAPYYLLDGARLTRDVPAGELIRLDEVEGADAPTLAAYLAGAARVDTPNGDDR